MKKKLFAPSLPFSIRHTNVKIFTKRKPIHIIKPYTELKKEHNDKTFSESEF